MTTAPPPLGNAGNTPPPNFQPPQLPIPSSSAGAQNNNVIFKRPSPLGSVGAANRPLNPAFSRIDRSAKRMTANLGSLFVFDTCKPSDLKNALDSMEDEEEPMEEATLSNGVEESVFDVADTTPSGSGAAPDMFNVFASESYVGKAIEEQQQKQNGTVSPPVSPASPPPSFSYGTSDSPALGNEGSVTADTNMSPSSSSPMNSPGSSPSATSAFDEFAYADEQLDAMIGMLGMDASQLVEDDAGLTDWLAEEAFSTFEFAPEWLEMTIAMKTNSNTPPPVQQDLGVSIPQHIQHPMSLPTSPVSSSTPNEDEAEALFSAQRRDRELHKQIQQQPKSTSPTFSRPMPPTAASGGTFKRPAPGDALNMAVNTAVDAPLPRDSRQAATSLVRSASMQPTSTRPYTPPPSIPSPAPPNAGNGGNNRTNPAIPPLSNITGYTSPPAANLSPSSSSTNMSPHKTGPQTLKTGNNKAPDGANSPFLLPASIMPTSTAPAAPGNVAAANVTKSNTGDVDNPFQLQEATQFITPLIVAPGLGETTVTLGASIYRLNRMMDPTCPFESVIHDEGAFDPSNPVVVLSPSVNVPPSAGSNQQAPPSFSVNALVIANVLDGIHTLTGIASDASTIVSSFFNSNQQLSTPRGEELSRQIAGAPLVMKRPQPKATASASPATPSTTSTPASATTSSGTSLNASRCIHYGPTSSLSSRSSSPHVLVATLAIVNPQGKTKRTVKLLVLALAPPEGLLASLPTLPPTFSQTPASVAMRSPQMLQGTDGHVTCLLSALSSAHGAVFCIPSSPSPPHHSVYSSAPTNTSDWHTWIARTVDSLTLAEVEDLATLLKVFQRLHYHSGPIRGNPHIRIMSVPDALFKLVNHMKTEHERGAVQADSSGAANKSQIYFHLKSTIESYLTWARAQSIGILRDRSDEEWLQTLTDFSKRHSTAPALLASAKASNSTWFFNPVISHMTAQTHVLRMEALMTSFDRVQAIAPSASSSSSAAPAKQSPPMNAKVAGAAKPKGALAKSGGGNSGPISPRPLNTATPSSGMSPRANPTPTPASRMTVATGGRAEVVSPRMASPSHSSAFPAPSPTQQSNPTVKRVVSVIGWVGSGRSSLINRACHARQSKQANGESFGTSTLMMSTLTSALGGDAAGANSTSAFADIFFHTSKCLLEFIETPSRSTNKIQFYKDVNRAHAFIFVYAGVHPSPAEVNEMQQSLQDILTAKSSHGHNNHHLSGSHKLSPNPGAATSSSTVMKKPNNVGDIPVIIVGTQAPPPPAPIQITEEGNEEQETANSQLMTLAQLIDTHRLPHFSVDTQPLHNSELGRALQWLYNRIGEYTLNLKGVRATNRPHHSGSIYVSSTSRDSAITSNNSGINPAKATSTAPQAMSVNQQNRSTIYVAGSAAPPNAQKLPSGAQGNNRVGNAVVSGVKRTATGPSYNPNASSAVASGTASGSSPSPSSQVNGATALNNSVATFMKVEALVVKMRGDTVDGASASGVVSKNWNLPISDRRFDNGAWVAIPNTGPGYPSSAPSSSAYMIGDDDSSSSSSSTKKKILAKCFSGNDAVDWTVEFVVRPASAAGGGASGSYLPSPFQLRTEAIQQHLQQLLDLSVIRCVYGGSESGRFLDSQDAFYRFQMDEDNELILNARKVWIGDVDVSEIETLAAWLYQKVQPFIVNLSSLTAPAATTSSYGSNNSASGMSAGNSSGGAGGSALGSASSYGQSANAAPSSFGDYGSYGASAAARTFVIDGEGFKQSAHFSDLLLFSAKLQKVSLKQTSHAAKVAFWINVYNILALHVTIQHGYVGKSKSKRKLLLTKTFYQVAGQVYSLDDIFHGILRGNRKNPNTSKVPFKPADARKNMVLHDDASCTLSNKIYGAISSTGAQLPPLDPRILFALTSLSKSSPFIAPMRPESLDAQLNMLTSAYLSAELDINFKNSSLGIPAYVQAYRSDISKAPAPLLTFFASFLESEKAKPLSFLANKIKEKDIKSKAEDTSPCAPRFKL